MYITVYHYLAKFCYTHYSCVKYIYCACNPRGCRLVSGAHVGCGGRAARPAADGYGQSVRARRAVPRAEHPALHGALEPRRRHLSGARARTLTACAFLLFTPERYFTFEGVPL